MTYNSALTATYHLTCWNAWGFIMSCIPAPPSKAVGKSAQHYCMRYILSRTASGSNTSSKSQGEMNKCQLKISLQQLMFLTIFHPELLQTYFWHNVTAHKLLCVWAGKRCSTASLGIQSWIIITPKPCLAQIHFKGNILKAFALGLSSSTDYKR